MGNFFWWVAVAVVAGIVLTLITPTRRWLIDLWHRVTGRVNYPRRTLRVIVQRAYWRRLSASAPNNTVAVCNLTVTNLDQRPAHLPRAYLLGAKLEDVPHIERPVGDHDPMPRDPDFTQREEFESSAVVQLNFYTLDEWPDGDRTDSIVLLDRYGNRHKVKNVTFRQRT